MTDKPYGYLTTFILAISAVLTLVLFSTLPDQSVFVERWFSRGFFSWYRVIWDHTIGFLPFAAIYLLITVVLIYLGSAVIRQHQVRSKLRLFINRLIRVLCIAVISFYWLWGFNYKRDSFREIAGMASAKPTTEFVISEYCRVTDSLIYLRQVMRDYTVDSFYVSESELRKELQVSLKSIGLPTSGHVRARRIKPKGSLLHISTAGVYLPFAGEGHIDAGLHPIIHPFTMMHEMSHGYGWTGEDVCNFLALIGTVNSKNPQVKYSGYFGYWRYLRSQVYQLDRDTFDGQFRKVDELVGRDYMEIIEYSNRYKDILPELRDLFYDNYLKSHGISSGLINYSQMIVLSYEWQQQHGSLLLNEVAKTKG